MRFIAIVLLLSLVALATNDAYSQATIDSTGIRNVRESEQLKTEHDTATYTHDLARYTRMLGKYTLGMVIVGGCTAVILVFQSIFLGLTVRQGRKTLVATLRPHIVVRDVDLIFDVHDKPLVVQFTVVNLGGTRATIIESRILIDFLGSARPYRPRYDSGSDVFGRRSFAPGASDTFRVDGRDMYNGSFDPTQLYLCLVGYIVYEDDLANKRRMGFCRECRDREHPRFYTSEDEAYEYAD